MATPIAAHSTDLRFHPKSEFPLDIFVHTLSAVGYRAGQILEVIAELSANEYELVQLTNQQAEDLKDRLASMHLPPALILTWDEVERRLREIQVILRRHNRIFLIWQSRFTIEGISHLRKGIMKKKSLVKEQQGDDRQAAVGHQPKNFGLIDLTTDEFKGAIGEWLGLEDESGEYTYGL